MKIVFFGTSSVGLPILKVLDEQHEVIYVVTSPDAPVGRKQILTPSPIATFAESLDIPISKPDKVKNNPGFLEELRQLHADIFIVVSYGKILPQELLDIPPLKTLNLHFSLLPKYRGAAPIQFALLNGETITGTTIFILDELVDHGPVLATAEYSVLPHDTFVTLSETLAEISAELLIDILPKYQQGELTPQEQNHDEATFTKIIKKEDGKVNWTKTAPQIFNMWRAYIAWPGIWTMYNGEVLKILECSVAEDETRPGTIPCGDITFLKLDKVQLAGKNPVTMADFLNGHKDFQATDLAI